MHKDIIFSRMQHLGLVTLARATSLNALTLPMIVDLQQQLLKWRDDPAVHAVVVQAEPGKAFCAGGDIRWLCQAGLAQDPAQRQFFWHQYRLNYFIAQYSKPYIVLMDGITMGGGVGISCHSKLTIAGEQFIFAMPETQIGLFPDVGASYILARLPASLGLYLGLTGERLGMAEALAAGVVKYALSPDNFSVFVPALAQMDLAENALLKVEKWLQQHSLVPEKKLLDLEKINLYFSLNSLEEIFAALQKSTDPWAEAVLSNLLQKSPLSLAVTFQLLQKAKTWSLDQCLQMDYCLVNHFMANHDFYEGVRALLIDKDKSPKWQPDQLAKVDAAKVAAYFASCEPQLFFIE